MKTISGLSILTHEVISLADAAACDKCFSGPLGFIFGILSVSESKYCIIINDFGWWRGRRNFFPLSFVDKLNKTEHKPAYEISVHS